MGCVRKLSRGCRRSPCHCISSTHSRPKTQPALLHMPPSTAVLFGVPSETSRPGRACQNRSASLVDAAEYCSRSRHGIAPPLSPAPDGVLNGLRRTSLRPPRPRPYPRPCRDRMPHSASRWRGCKPSLRPPCTRELVVRRVPTHRTHGHNGSKRAWKNLR